MEGSCKNTQFLFVSLWIKAYIIIPIQVLSIPYEGSQAIVTQKNKQPEYMC